MCKYKNKIVCALKCLFSECKYNMGIIYPHRDKNRLYIQKELYMYMFISIHTHTYVYVEADVLHMPLLLILCICD